MKVTRLADVRVGSDSIVALSIREGLVSAIGTVLTVGWPGADVSLWLVIATEPQAMYRARDVRDPDHWREELAALEAEVRAHGGAGAFLAVLVTRAPLDSREHRRFVRSQVTGFPVGPFLELSGAPRSWRPRFLRQGAPWRG